MPNQTTAAPGQYHRGKRRTNVKRQRWADIQDGEFSYHAAKDPARVLDYKLPYWRELIAALPDEIRFDENTRVLDLGCGGSSLLLALDGGPRVGLDPLMGRYIEQFPYLKERREIDWVEGAAEDVKLDREFDVVFAINSFDHVQDPARVVERIRDWLVPGGHCVVTMNTHNTRFFRAYYRRLYRVIDHHHPYQFTADEIRELFGILTHVETREIDEMWFPYAEGYYKEVLGRGLEDRRKWVKGAVNPFKWPMGFCKFVLDMPPHKKRPGQRSIYSDCLYVFRKDA